MSTITLQRGWHEQFAGLVRGARRELLIVAPYITRTGTDFIEQRLARGFHAKGTIHVVTDLNPKHVCDGSLDTDAVHDFVSAQPGRSLWHVPGVHAKVYAADAAVAIVTSGNLTAGAFYKNVELGICSRDRGLVGGVCQAVRDMQALGASIPLVALTAYAQAARTARRAALQSEKSVDPALRTAVRAAVRGAENQLVRIRLAGGAMHTVFARTILLLLTRDGPLRTPILHEYVRALHPDLCDDRIDRVIDGKHFGKKWKHAVRTAQQQLKQRGLIERAHDVWRLTAATDRTL